MIGSTRSTTFTVLDPATQAVVGSVPNQGADDALRAVDVAFAAGRDWAKAPFRSRSDVLFEARQLMMRDRDRLAALISAENGKSLTDAAGEVAYAAESFRWFAEEGVRPGGEYGESPGGGTRTIVRHVPVGVAALVTPWNFPAAMATRKLAPALAAGCSIVLKPAAETPLTALAVADLLEEAGVPKGIVNVVTTTAPAAVVGTWLQDDRVRKISFTGSTRIGRLLLSQAADRVVNASMELGGNAPFIVTEDANLEAAVTGAMIAKFRNAGQACTAANRFLVHADVYDEFAHRFGIEIEKLTVGPAADGCAIGPMISAAARSRVENVLAQAEAAGARISHRADVPPNSMGHFVAPTLLLDVASDAPILSEEIFGPLAPVVRWTDEDQMLEQVNATEYGLAAYVYSRDLARAIRISESIQAGMVAINRGHLSDPSAPFGGVKQSGLGREGARDGLREFQETQYLSVDWPT